MMPLNHILRKYTGGCKLTKSQEKINHQKYMDDIKLFAKNETRIGNLNTGSENIRLGYRDGIWHRKMCHANNEKPKKANKGKNRTTNSRKIRTLGEKENYKCLGILGADTIKQAKMKKENLKRVSQESKKTTRNQNI